MNSSTSDRAPWEAASPYLIGEIGVNHDGSMSRARALIGDAASAGFSAVKLQHWYLDELLTGDAPRAPYQGAGTQNELLAALRLDVADLRVLMELAHERGLDFIVTPFGERALTDLVDLRVDCVKVGSGDLDNPWILDGLATAGLPVILSTGMAVDEEVELAAARLAGLRSVAFLHCVTAYPTPLAEANLARIGRIGALTGRPVGFSDHTVGDAAAAAAVALGATIIEKHITWSTQAVGPDHAASLDMANALAWVEAVRGVAHALSASVASEAEAVNRPWARKALYYAADLGAGEVLQRHHLVALRPLGDGVAAGARDQFVGHPLTRSVRAGEPLVSSDVR